jgi:hypothetical protein
VQLLERPGVPRSFTVPRMKTCACLLNCSKSRGALIIDDWGKYPVIWNRKKEYTEVKDLLLHAVQPDIGVATLITKV